MSQLLPLLIVQHDSPSSELLDSEVENFVVNVLANLLIALVFGLASPYLGILIRLGLIIRTYIFICLSQRYVDRSSLLLELELLLLPTPPDLIDQQKSTDTDLPSPSPFDLSSAIPASF